MLRRRSGSLIAAVTALLKGVAAIADPSVGDHLDLSVTDQFSYDDNLFRLPTAISTQSVGPGAHREDDINQLGIGIDTQWSISQQRLLLGGTLDDNRYVNNAFLDNIGGNGRAEWDWTVGKYAVGQVAAQYTRTLADFAITQVYGKDSVDMATYVSNGQFFLSPHWSFTAAGQHSQTSQSLVQLQFENNSINTGIAGIEYASPSNSPDLPLEEQNAAGLKFQYSHASYAAPELLGDTVFYTDYSERLAKTYLRYSPTSRVMLQADVGYLHRSYADHAIGNFSGDVWHASAQWALSDRTTLLVAGWRELRAFIEAQANYFVGTGFRIEPTWSPTEKISLALKQRWERQDYTGTNVATILIPRRDTVQDAIAALTYSPRRWIQLSATYHLQQRSSNLYAIAFDDHLTMVGLRLTL